MNRRLHVNDSIPKYATLREEEEKILFRHKTNLKRFSYFPLTGGGFKQLDYGSYTIYIV